MAKMKRRDFLRVTTAVAAGVILSSCKPKTPTPEPTKAPAQPTKAAAQPTKEAAKPAGKRGVYPPGLDWFKPRAESLKNLPVDHKPGELITQEEWYALLGDPPKEEIEAAFWLEGYGHGWVKFVASLLEKEHPGAKVKVWGDPRIWETLQPRLVDGDIPDVGRLWIKGGEQAMIQGVKDNVYAPVDILLDVEAYGWGEGKRVRDIIPAGGLEGASMGLTDAQWAMPLTQNANGIYYNVAMFEEHGWPDPGTLTWEEFMDLCAEIKKAGIAPWTYQGKYPGYFNIVLRPLIYKSAGAKAVCDIDNLVEGAWKNPDVLWAMEQIQLIFKNGWIFPGAEAMSHTEGQQVFMDGKAAFVPCGMWMEREMEETTPEGFRMKLIGIPAPKNGKGNPKAAEVSEGGPALTVGNGKHPLWGMEYLRLVYSPDNAKYWAEKIGALLAVKDPLQGATNVSEALQSGIDLIKSAEGHYIKFWYGAWYPTIGKVWGDNMGDFLWGRVSVEEMADMLERAAREVREDPTIEKHKRTDCSD
ncbi:MAG: extracellular solute-binding protein [Anaerolineae bacterium]|nr:extracellular solute-binding protein [Anaerolineae bacterium]